MMPLNFQKEVAIAEIFIRYKFEVYDRLVDAIEKGCTNPSVDKVEVMTLTIGNTEYTIDLLRHHFIGSLKNAIEVYEGAEEYEKCQRCILLLNILRDQSRKGM